MTTFFVSLILVYSIFNLIYSFRDQDKIIGISVLVHLGLLGSFLFVLNNSFGFNYKVGFIILMFLELLILLILTFSSFRKRNIYILVIKKHLKNLKVYHLLYLLLLLLILRSLCVPVRGWDAYALYDSRAKMFINNVKLSDMSSYDDFDDNNKNYYFSYPPMTSSIHAAIYSIDISSPMFVYSLFYVSYALLIVYFIRKLRIKTLHKLLIFLAAVLNPIILNQVNIAYTNLPMLAFLTGSIVLLITYSEDSKARNLVVSAVLLAFSTWTRYFEPTYIVVIASAFYLIYKKHFKQEKNKALILSFVYISISVSLRHLWSHYLNGTDLESVYVGKSYLASFISSLTVKNIGDVFNFLVISLESYALYFLLLILVFLYHLFYLKKRTVRLTNKVVVILMNIAGLFALYVGGTLVFSVTRAFWRNVPGSLSRSLLIVVPLIVIYYALVLESVANTKRHKVRIT